MALNAARLSASIKAKRIAKLGAAVANNAALTADCDAIAEAVIDELTGFGTVTTPTGVAVQVAPATGTGATIAPGVGAIT